MNHSGKIRSFLPYQPVYSKEVVETIEQREKEKNMRSNHSSFSVYPVYPDQKVKVKIISISDLYLHPLIIEMITAWNEQPW